MRKSKSIFEGHSKNHACSKKKKKKVKTYRPIKDHDLPEYLRHVRQSVRRQAETAGVDQLSH